MTEAVDITGKWNPEEAKKIALSVLQNFSWKTIIDFCSSEVDIASSCKPEHHFLGEYSLSYKDREVKIVATDSIEKLTYGTADCHACAPYLSFFEFEKRATGWKLVNPYIATLRFGSFGKVRPEGVNVYEIGNNNFGIQLEGGFTNNGVTVMYTSIYANVGDSLSEVLELQTAEENGAALPKNNLTAWESKLAFQACTTRFCDLQVQRDGIRKGQPFHERELFKFNGRKYVSDELYQ
jgi:hypothetical protein